MLGRWIVGMALLGSVSASSLFSLGVSVGPFSLSLDGVGVYDEGYGDRGYIVGRRGTPVVVQRRLQMFDNPICYAIQQRKLLEMTVEWTENIDAKNLKSTIKRITIEPYLFGRDRNGNPILRGKIISDVMLKEVAVKFGDEPRDPNADWRPPAQDAFSGRYNSLPAEKGPAAGNLDTLSVERITNVRVIERSQFNPPKDFSEIFKDGIAEVICTVSLSPA